MPEGPEVRTVAAKLRPTLVNRVISNAYKGERGSSLGFENLKFPSIIIAVRSYGKKVIIDTQYNGVGYIIVASLGMTGRLQYTKGNHSHIYFEISEYQSSGPFNILRPVFNLYFDDTRYMGRVDIIPNSDVPAYFSNIGPDLLQAALDEKTYITSEQWKAIFGLKKVQNWTLRKALMDQSLVSGIGNYAISEICYYSALNPERTIGSLSEEEMDRLRIISHKILLLSYSWGGFTIESFISPDGEYGRYPAAVYGKKFDSYGNPVVKVKAKDGRTSHWVPAIQY